MANYLIDNTQLRYPIPKIKTGLPDLGQSSLQLPQFPPTDLGVPRMYKYPIRRPPQEPSTMVDYNDPYQLNSMADVILTTLNPDMKRGNWGGLEQIPGLNIITGSLDLLNTDLLKPALAGDWRALGVNSLVNLSETLDVTANPIKAAAMGQDPMDAMGWGGRGRQNFDYNTGNIVTDMGAELLSDPLNWVTLFGKGLITFGAKSAIKSAIKTVAGEAGKDVTDLVYKRLSKRAIKAYLEGDFKTMDQSIRAVAQGMQNKGMFQFITEPLTADFVNALQKTTIVTKDMMTNTALAGLQTIVSPVEKLERTLFKAGLMGGIYPVWWPVTKGKSMLDDYLQERSLSVLQKYKRPDGRLSILDYPQMKQDVDANNTLIDMGLKGATQAGLAPEALEAILHASIQKEREVIGKLRTEYTNKPTDLLYALLNDVQQTHHVKSIEEYIAGIEEINKVTDDAFAYYSDELKELFQDIKQWNIAARYERTEGAVQLRETALKSFVDVLGDMFTPTPERNLYAGLMENTPGGSSGVRLADGTIVGATAEEGETAATKSLIVAGVIPNNPREGFANLQETTQNLLKDFYRKNRYVPNAHFNQTIEEFMASKGLSKDYADYKLMQKHGSRQTAAYYEPELDLRRALKEYERLDKEPWLHSEVVPEDVVLTPVQKRAGVTIHNALQDYVAQGPDAENLTILEYFKKRGLETTYRVYNKDIDDEFFLAALLRAEVPKQTLKYKLQVLLDNYFEQSWAPLLRYFKENPAIYNTQIPFYQMTIDQIESLVKDYFVHIWGQINDIDIFAAPPKLDFDSYNLFGKVELEFQNAQKLFKDILEASQPEVEGAVKYNNALEMLQKDHKIQTDLLNDLQQKAELGVQTREAPLKVRKTEKAPAKFTQKVINEANNKLTTLFENDLEGWWGKQDGVPHLRKTEAWNHAAVQKSLLHDQSKVYGGLLVREIKSKIHNMVSDFTQEIFSKGVDTKFYTEYLDTILKEFEDATQELRSSFAAAPNFKQIEQEVRAYAQDLFESMSAFGEQGGASKKLFSKLVELKNWAKHPTVATGRDVNEKLGVSYHKLEEVYNNFTEASARITDGDDSAPALELFAESWAQMQRFTDGLAIKNNTFMDVATLFQEHSAYDIIEPDLKVTMDGVLHQLKQEQTWTLFTLISNPGVSQLVQDIVYNAGEVGGLVNKAALRTETEALKVTAQTAQQIIDIAQRYNALIQFMNRIAQAGLTSATRRAFITTLQKFARVPLEKVQNNFEFYFTQIAQSATDYVNTITMKESFSLNILEEIDHQAAGDVQALIRVIRDRLVDKFDNSQVEYLVVDIEKTGLLEEAHSVLEIAYKKLTDADNVGVTLLRRDVDPNNALDWTQQSVLDTFWKGDSKEVQEAKYLQRYSGHGKNEQQILQEFINNLRQLQASSRKQIGLVFHNGNNFDVPAIVAAMKSNKIAPADIDFFEKLNTYDTYQMLRKKAGYFEIDPREARILKRQLNLYLQDMRKTNSVRMIDPNNGAFARHIKNFAEDLRRTAYNDDFTVVEDQELLDYATELDQIGSEVYEALRDVAKVNEVLGDLYLDKAWLSTLEGKAYFIEHLRKHLDMTGEQIVEKYGMYLNFSKMLYALTEEGNYLGYRNAVDFKVIREYFDFGTDDVIGFRLSKSLTSLGKYLQRTYDRIKNGQRLNIYADEIHSAVQKLVPKYNEPVADASGIFADTYSPMLGQKVDMFLSHVRTDKKDVMSNWAILQYLYDQYMFKAQKNPILARYLQENVSPDVLQLLSSDGRVAVYGGIVPGTSQTRIESLSDLVIDPKIANPLARREVAAVQQAGIDRLKNIGQSTDYHKYSRSKAQALATDLEYTQQMLDVFVRQLDALPLKARTEYVAQSKAYGNELAMQQIYNVLTLDTPTLRALMAHRAPWIEFDIRELTHSRPHVDAVRGLLQRRKELKDVGILIESDGTRIYLGFDSTVKLKTIKRDGVMSVTLDNTIIPAPKIPELDLARAEVHLHQINDAGEVVANTELAGALKNARAAMERLSDSRIAGSLGDTVNIQFFEDMYHQLPEAVRKKFMKLEDITNTQLFRKVRYNFTNLGTLETRRIKNEFSPSNIVTLYKKNSERTAVEAETKFQYLEMYYAKEFGLNVGWMKGAPAEEIIKAFKDSPEYVLSALVEDGKGGFKAVMIRPTSVQAIKEARRLDAVVMPYHTFSKAHEVMNAGEFDSKALNIWHKIIYAFKVGYLLDPGVWMRNFIDSVLKTTISTGEFQAVGGTLAHSAKLLHSYDSVVDQIIQMDPHGRFRQSNLEFYFDNMADQTKLDRESFDFVHSLIMDGAAVGLTGRWIKYYKHMDTADELWPTFVHVTNKAMTPNRYIEQVNRLAQHMLLRSRGVDSTKSFYQIAKTHFDYALKSDAERYIELVFPFYTFTMRNLEYWVEIMLDKPWIAAMFRDIMTPAWDFDGTSYYELSHNKSLQYQILSGNIPLSENGMTLKTSPSFMDVFNMLTNPVGSVESKLFAPLQQGVEVAAGGIPGEFGEGVRSTLNAGSSGTGIYDQAQSLIPILGTAYQRYFEQGATYAERTGNAWQQYTPGIFGATLRYQPKPKKKFPKTKKVRRPRKKFVRRTWAKKTFFKRVWADKTYFHNYWHRFHDPYESFYNKNYTKTGASRLKMRMIPVTPGTLKYRIKDMWGYFRR